ncbi:MAG: hypothetical protein VYA17_05865 [Pseudomonadota bacterium]|nr:hypothetical protein [Pseudomonadota bacterium]
MTDNLNIVYGDIHNHNAHGYGLGSIERSVEVAQTHLDFFAFTGHSSWHDLGAIENGAEEHFNKGFERLAETWPHVQNVIAESNSDHEFCSFLGFEWHSNFYGDQCVVFPEDFQEIHYAQTLAGLRRFCVSKSALMIPHHLAYPKGRRGVNWEEFNNECTPVVEIYSWHGNSEDDRGPYPMIKGSPGGRETSNTVSAALAGGNKFGFVASSDNHSAFPGAYGEGLMGALVADLTRSEILKAIRERRTFALTGDRIELHFHVNGSVMGSDINAGDAIDVEYLVRGRDEIEMVEVVQDGIVVHRSFADEFATPETGFQNPFQIRLEWGWGPWASLALDRITDWQMTVSIRDGKLLKFYPCLSSGPFDEDRRHRFRKIQDNILSIDSYTSRRQAYRENPNQSVVLAISGGPETLLEIQTSKPTSMQTTSGVADLFAASEAHHVGEYPAESYMWHRILPVSATTIEDRCTLAVGEGRSNVYLRVKQKNGHLAWSSPVFINHT